MMEGVTYFGETWDFFDLALKKCMFAINDRRSDTFWGNLGFL